MSSSSPASGSILRFASERRLAALLVALLLLVLPTASWATTAQEMEAERTGLGEPEAIDLPIRDLGAQQQAQEMLPLAGLLLIPESSNDRVMAFDPATGDLVDADFIPADPDNLSTPLQAILNASGDGILLSDQIEDVVNLYDLDGNFVRIFAPVGGVDTSILDNIRGIALRPNGNLLVTVGGGTNADAIAEFDTDGTYLGNFVANGAAGLDSPFDIIETFAGTWLSGGITSDIIHEYDADGAPLPDFAPIDNFPEQLQQIANGNVLAANFGGSQEGVVEFDGAGMVVGVYDAPSLGGYRGVYELPNGNILTTNGGGVHEIDRNGALVETKIAGVSARFISLVRPSVPPPLVIEVPTASQWGLAGLGLLLALAALMALRRRSI